MNKIVSLLSILFLIGCSTTHNNLVSLNCSSVNSNINENDFWNDIDARMIEIEADMPVQRIKDVCVMDSLLYILTTDKSIICVNTENGNKIREIQRIGHAKNEMIKPAGIAADENFLYVHDTGMRQFQVLDKDMNFVKNIPVKGFFDTFVKCKEGFLCGLAVNGTKVTMYDNDGEMKYEQQISSMNYGSSNFHSGFNIFVKDPFGDVYAKADFSDSLYVWDGNELCLKYEIDLGEKHSNKTSTELWNIDNSATLGYFMFSNHVIFTTKIGRTIKYHLYDFKGNNHFVGIPVRINDIPFYPKYQNGNMLFNVLPKCEFKSDKDDPLQDKKIDILIYEYQK